MSIRITGLLTLSKGFLAREVLFAVAVMQGDAVIGYVSMSQDLHLFSFCAKRAQLQA